MAFFFIIINNNNYYYYKLEPSSSIIYDFYTLSTTTTLYLRLLHSIYDFYSFEGGKKTRNLLGERRRVCRKLPLLRAASPNDSFADFAKGFVK